MDLTGISIDLSDYIEIATFLVVSLVSFWAIMKGIDLWGSKTDKLRYVKPFENDAQYDLYLSRTENDGFRRRTWY